MATTPYRCPLTHLFTVLYTDGEQFTQPHDDRPRHPRPDGSGSAFSDVDLARVRVFFLEGNGHLYQVHLDDGHFEIDGVPLLVGDDAGVELGPLRLVFFRRVAHDQHTDVRDGARVGEPRPGETRRSYFLGWEANVRDSHGRLTDEVRRRVINVGHETFRP